MAAVRWHAVVNCTACGHRFDSAHPGTVATRAPIDGDYSVCFYCGEVAVYVIGPFGVALREATTEELARFAADPANTGTVRRIHLHQGERGGE